MMKRNKIWKIVYYLFIAVCISICARDIVISVADSFLPKRELTIEKTDLTNDYPVRIYNEGKQYEVFDVFQGAVSNHDETGWKYEQGEAGVSWTRITAEKAGASFTVSLRENPDCFFTCNKSKWCGAFVYYVDGGEPVTVDCYDENSEGELIWVYPFSDVGADTRIRLQIIVHIIVSMICFFLLYFISTWFSKRTVKKAAETAKSSERTRLRQLDYVRGIAMLLVIAGHCYIPEPFWTSIYSFHMPLFFMITGCCHGAAGNHSQLTPESTSISERVQQELCYVYKSIRKCISPYLFFSVLGMLLSFTFYSVYGAERSISQINTWTHGVLFGIGHVSYTGYWGAIWFLLAEFWLLLITHVIEKTDKFTVILSCVACPIIAVYFIPKHTILGVVNPFNIGAAMMGVPMYYVGYAYIKYLHKKIKSDTNGFVLSVILIGCGLLLAKQNNSSIVNFSGNSYGKISYMIPGAMMTALGIIVLSDVWYSIHHAQHGIISRALEAVGRNSIVFLGLHGMLIVLVRVLYRALHLPENWLTVSIGVLIMNGSIVALYQLVRKHVGKIR